MASVNLADVMNQIGEFQKTMQADRTTAANSLEENRRLGEERVAAAQTLVDLSTKQTQIENDQKLQMEERKKATADAFGVDILDPNNRLVMLASEQAAQIDNYIQRSKRAQNLIDMNMFDSPLDYFLVRPFAHRDINAALYSPAYSL